MRRFRAIAIATVIVTMAGTARPDVPMPPLLAGLDLVANAFLDTLDIRRPLHNDLLV